MEKANVRVDMEHSDLDYNKKELEQVVRDAYFVVNISCKGWIFDEEV